jgi:hypothetical protein
MKRIGDIAAEAAAYKQQARLYSEARLVLVQRHLTDPVTSFDALETVLSALLVGANTANQRAEALLATRVRSGDKL